MRIDEAIHYLERIKQEYDCSYEEDALNMAIAALSRSENPNKWISADVLDKIRAEIEQKARPNEIGGRGNGKSIRYGLGIALQIIDKYKAESEG